MDEKRPDDTVRLTLGGVNLLAYSAPRVRGPGLERRCQVDVPCEAAGDGFLGGHALARPWSASAPGVAEASDRFGFLEALRALRDELREKTAQVEAAIKGLER